MPRINFLRSDFEIDRRSYLIIGIVLFGVKHNLDRFIAARFGRPFSIFNYWISPVQIIHWRSMATADVRFLLTLLAIAVPFVIVGVGLTLARLRSAGAPLSLSVLFFVPVVNLVLFLTLAILPPKQVLRSEIMSERAWSQWLRDAAPKSRMGSALGSAAVVAILGLGATFLATAGLRNYGWGLFVGLPFCLGFLSSLAYGLGGPRKLRDCIGVACLATTLLALLLMAFALEGVFCLVMALPLALPLAVLGAMVGHVVQWRPRSSAASPTIILGLVLFIPGFMTFEHRNQLESPIFKVESSIDVDAPAEAVWRQVVTFAEIPPPSETIFRLGIAYPVRATISGRGPGAIRRCEFTTGPFVEPITVWDEPQLLRFRVESNPAPMQEWTFYRHINPPHLNGFLESRQGQFQLVPLGEHRTRLIGTTWYQHHLFPAVYWQIWSDAIIHRIHLRVLRHIKSLAECDAGSLRP